jgi:hypothetical protein
MLPGKKTWLGVLLFTSAFFAAGLLLPKLGIGGVTICSFRRMTGHGCPGCGMTRSVTAFLQGDPRRSIEMHLFGPILVFVAAGFWARSWIELFRSVPRPFSFSGTGWTIGLTTFIVLYLVYWGVRMATGTTP